MNDPLPRVALLVQGDEEYGVGQVARALAAELQRRGGKPALIALEEGALTKHFRAEAMACRVLGLPAWPPFERSVWKTAKTMIGQRFRLRRASHILAACLDELSADQLVVQWPAHVELAGHACRRAGIAAQWMMPNVVSDRWPLGLNRRFYRQLCRRLQITPLPNSRYTANSLGLDVRGQVLYLGVDETRFAPDRVTALTRAELGLPKDAYVAGVFARLDPSKGQEVLWRAMLALLNEGHDLHLLLVGGPADNHFANQLRDIARESNATARLHFAGWSDEPERYYDAIDFAVNSTIIPESFGLSVVEAMSMGRPILVHALGGPAETVVDGVTGWHVPQPTVEAFTTGLRRAMRDRPRWPELGQAARRHALEHFSASTFVSNYLRIIGKGNSGGE